MSKWGAIEWHCWPSIQSYNTLAVHLPVGSGHNWARGSGHVGASVPVPHHPPPPNFPSLFFSGQFAEAVPEGWGFVIVMMGEGVGQSL
jgi:hypothetical protein